MRQTSILIIGFARPELVEKKLESLAHIFNGDIMVSIDGPKSYDPHLDTEWKKQMSLFQNVRWKIQIENLGLARHVTEAISKELENYDNCIVLEDDVVVSVHALHQVRKLLSNRLPSNILTVGFFGGLPRIWFLSKYIRNSWRLSRYFSAWGWAVQREDWMHFTLDLAKSQSKDLRLAISETFRGYKMRVWQRRLEVVKSNPRATWDYQVFFLGLLMKKKHLQPTFRSCENVGFADQRSTNTKERRPFWYFGKSNNEIESTISLSRLNKSRNWIQLIDSFTWAGDSRFYTLTRKIGGIRAKLKRR